MAEYIDREALMEFPIRANRCDKEHANEHFLNGIETVLEYAERLPTVYAEVVVRCRDCKYSRLLNKNEKEQLVDGVLMCTNSEVSEYGITDVWGTHFCSYGERKDADNAT